LFSSSIDLLLSSWHVRGCNRPHGATVMSAAHPSLA
jgi:hypothetical protein